MVSKRTRILTCERPLDPPPPYNAHPYFCLINTLIFYDRKSNEVWRQEIPEADHVRVAKRPDGTYDIKQLGSVSVRRDRHFGWQLRVTYTHELAERAWPFEVLTVRKLTIPGKKGTCPHLRGVP